jgi:hypothetical protein
MNKLLSQLTSTVLAVTALVAVAPHSASAASLQGQASAVIQGGIAMRSPGDFGAAPIVQAAHVDQPSPRVVTRPCRPNDPTSSAKCRMVLLDLQ